MCEAYGIDDKTRFLVLYFDAQLGPHEISRMTNRPLRTIRKWEKRTKNGEDIRVIKKVTRKKLITEETENKIIQMLKENPEGTSTTKLAARIGLSQKSIAKVLAKKGYKYKAYDTTIMYSEEERMARINFCKKMLSNEGIFIYRGFFSDEMGVDLNKNHKTKVWQLATEKIKRKSVTETIKLNCWGAISARGATSLDIYEKSTTGSVYREVIKRHKAEMEKIYSDGEFFFVQDNHPAHKVSEEWIEKEQGLKLIKLPKRSPDLNIIENLWAALKERIKCEAPANEKELRASLLSNWDRLTKSDRLQPFFEGLHRRYMECISIDGQKLPY